ncbi:DNA-binding MarR family transcriptional regulator [Kineococcus xinjiangensis]|uniref:DNA-binding MarR family transcriptional regulator n=1 Tax=Kineococcus xinjiangensis TaxID=512762 RepID=A0A2S6IJ51_9ACTN|nr:MarR family transcriptional regulator [Kineococcus xinjiangensis]PPK94254.1 DNA-binding MarR family transcriptional regulator [Kineococcus xinjiangensis]
MPDVSDESLAQSWHDLMGRYARLTCRLDRELEAAHGLSSSEFEVLQQLHGPAGPGKLRMTELGERAHLSQSALSRLVGRLERDGLVRRAACEADRRAVWIHITDAGRARYQEAQPTQRAILRTETWCAAVPPPEEPAG